MNPNPKLEPSHFSFLLSFIFSLFLSPFLPVCPSLCWRGSMQKVELYSHVPVMRSVLDQLKVRATGDCSIDSSSQVQSDPRYGRDSTVGIFPTRRRNAN